MHRGRKWLREGLINNPPHASSSHLWCCCLDPLSYGTQTFVAGSKPICRLLPKGRIATADHRLIDAVVDACRAGAVERQQVTIVQPQRWEVGCALPSTGPILCELSRWGEGALKTPRSRRTVDMTNHSRQALQEQIAEV